MYPDHHGGIDYLELQAAGINPGDILDFSVNSNPFGPTPRLQDALRHINPSLYPDRQANRLTVRLSELNHTPAEEVLVCNGAAEAIWLAAHALLKPGDVVIMAGPTFGEYYRACGTVGAKVVDCRAGPPDFQIDLQTLESQILCLRPRLVFLCNPNNPTGQSLTDQQVGRIADACAPGLLILDEAYRSFVILDPFSPRLDRNAVILRSMTKDFALAGLRLGYVLAGRAEVGALRANQPPWSVNSLAQAAGLAALDDLPHTLSTLGKTQQISREFQADLKAAGANLVPSQTHYCLVNCGDQTAAAFRARLLQKWILTRDCASFGLPHHLRIAARLPQENQIFIQAWTEVTS